MSAQPQTVERRAEADIRPSFVFTDAQRAYIQNVHKAEMLGLLEYIAEEIIEHRLREKQDWLLPVLEILDKHRARIDV